MYDLTIYLAGKMGGLTIDEMNSWRVEAKTILEKLASNIGCSLKVINPVTYYNFEEKRHQSEKEIEDFDLAHVISSDIVLVNLDGLNTSDGTKYEIYEAYKHHGIPVIAFGDRNLYEELHPWVKSKITRVEESIIYACYYIRDFYMI